MRSFEVRRDDIRQHRLFESETSDLSPGAARLRLDLFSLTSNNVTYAAIGGGPLGYWDFFPPAPGEEAWGRTPVWGFATVVASSAEGVDVGRRVYGYFPMSETLDVQPAKVGASGFFDAAPHRRSKAAIYNRYAFTEGDPAYHPDFEAEQTLFRPLFATGWLAADCVARLEPKPEAVIISSASSKTAFATAHEVRARGLRVIGLTSKRNMGFVTGTKLYDEVVGYDDVSTLAPAAPAVFVDYLGRRALTAQVHAAAGEALSHSLVIGVADWESLSASREPVPGPRPEMFFAPGYMESRGKDDGPALLAALDGALRDFYPKSRELVRVRRETGPGPIGETWATLVEGAASPSDGFVLSFG